ncbi:MAG: hypothetical protein WCP39_04015 [Chlamydiota bacterium]
MKEFEANFISLFCRPKRFEIRDKGILIHIETSPLGHHLIVSTLVFSENNCIPPSVRKCAKTNRFFEDQKFSPYLQVEEEAYYVYLRQKIPVLFPEQALGMVKKFIFLARFWAIFLKYFAKKDLQSLPKVSLV